MTIESNTLAGGEGNDVDAIVLAEQVRDLYVKAPLALATVPIIAATVAYVSGSGTRPLFFVVWLCVVVVITAARARLVLAYRRQPARFQAVRWARYFGIGSDVSALSWAVGTVMLFESANLPHQVFLVFVIGGMAAGAVTSLSSYPRVLYSYMGITVAALAARLLSEGDQVHVAMGAMLALFGVALALIGRSSGRSFAEATTLRAHNSNLVERLSVVRDDLAKTNEELESRVRARSRDLARFRGVLDHAEEVIVLARTSDLRIVDANAEATALIGGAQELSGRCLPDFEILDGQMPGEQWQELIQRLRAGGPKTLEITRRPENGDELCVEATTSVREFENEEFLLVVLRDVTARKQLETQLVKSDLLASIGRLAGGVGHEINNPLSYVISNLDYIKIVLQENRCQLGAAYTDVEEALADSEHGAAAIRDIVRSLGTLVSSREEASVASAVSISSVLDSCINVVANEMRSKAKLIRKYKDAPMVRGSFARLSQVFLNLLTNASQSFADEATQENHIEIVSGEADGMAWVEIRDSGSGIGETELDHIFDPFVTTRANVGVGLGLFVTRTIVRDLGGDVVARNGEKRGACFRVTLPVAAPELPEREPAARAFGRVLVIDDEPLVGRSLQRALVPHEVCVVTSGKQGVARLAKEHFDVVLCDVMMPGMSGIQVYEHLKEHAPTSAKSVVFLTGAVTKEIRSLLDAIPNPTLSKPYDRNALLKLIENRLESRRVA